MSNTRLGMVKVSEDWGLGRLPERGMCQQTPAEFAGVDCGLLFGCLP